MLQSHSAGGERVLLLYPTGLEFIAAFFGCLYAGVIAVPVPPPNPAQPQRTLPRLRAITNDARPSVALTTSSILSKIGGLLTETPDLQTMRWLATDKVADDAGVRMGRACGDEQHAGFAPIHFRLYHRAQGCNGQSRQPPP